MATATIANYIASAACASVLVFSQPGLSGAAHGTTKICFNACAVNNLPNLMPFAGVQERVLTYHEQLEMLFGQGEEVAVVTPGLFSELIFEEEFLAYPETV